MTDQCAGREIARDEIARHEIAGHENDGPKMTTGREIEKKYSFNRDNTRMNCAHF